MFQFSNFSGRRAVVKLAAAAAFTGALLAPLAANAQIREHKIRFAFVTAPDTGKLNGADKFAEIVKVKSGGKINIQLFPGGALGGDLQMISAMQGGILDMGVMGTNALVGVHKDFALFDFPYLFDNDREASAVIDGPVGKQLFDQLATTKGIVGMPISAFGFRHLHNSKRPIEKAEDVAGLKLRVIQSPMYVDLMGTMGANPVAMSFTEVYNAMEQKAIDGMTNTALIADSMKAAEVQKYFSLTRHMYNYIVLLISKKTWDKFNNDEKALIAAAANEVKDFQRKQLVELTAQALAKLKQNGMVVNEVPPAEIAKLRAKAASVVDKYAKELSPGLVQQANAAVAALRK